MDAYNDDVADKVIRVLQTANRIDAALLKKISKKAIIPSPAAF